MKKVLFIDRDGTLIEEPPDFQIDSFAKLKFLPNVIENLGKIARELEYELVLVSNQDGLETASFPRRNFSSVQNFILQTLENEGIIFSKIHVDRSVEADNKPTRKPQTGMLTEIFRRIRIERFVLHRRPRDRRSTGGKSARKRFLSAARIRKSLRVMMFSSLQTGAKFTNF